MGTMWMVRAWKGGEAADQFLAKGVVAVGYGQGEAFSESVTKDDLLRYFAQREPDAAEASRASWASQCLRFIREIKVGDEMLTYDGNRRLYYLGKVVSGYEFNPKALDDPEYGHVHRVKWTHKTARDVLNAEARNSLGSTLTLFKVPAQVAEELRRHMVDLNASAEAMPVSRPHPVPMVIRGEDDAEDRVAADMFAKADGFIEDTMARLSWDQMQEVVAGILRAMGYRTKVSPSGSDRGVDVFASPDGLGLQEPRIFVQVKHRGSTPMGPEPIRSLMNVGGRRAGDKCLFVSTGGFTRDAMFEAERAQVPVALLNLSQLRTLLVEQYENLDAQTRSLVPLKRLYWPTA